MVPPLKDFSQRDSAGVGLGGNIPSSDTQVGGCDLSFYAHSLFSLPDFWREAPRGHGLDHAHFRRPVHIWRSQWVPLHLLPVSAVQALPGPEATLLCILLCVYVGGLSPSAGVCMGGWVVTLQGVIAHTRACACVCVDTEEPVLLVW